MKKLFLLLALVICLSLCACGDPSDGSSEPPKAKIDSCEIVVNTSQDDTTTDKSIFNQSNDNVRSIYAHFMIQCADSTAEIRVKIESQWGRNEITEEDFKVETDKIVSLASGEWQHERMSMASNLYYWRITLYNGESNEILATKTVYTPYEKTMQTTVSNTAPDFHPINGLTSKEQELYDICYGPISKYASTNHYEGFSYIFNAWEHNGKIYMCIYYKNPSKMIWFAIDKNTKDYVAHFNNKGIIPNGVGTADQCVLHDYFYVDKKIAEAMNK